MWWQQIIGKFWRIIPRWLRVFLSRLPQTKFTISSGAVVFNRKGEVLLLNHILRPSSGWGIPGGFIEAGEQPDTGLHREIAEETGLKVENVHLISYRMIGRHLEIIYRCETTGEPQVLSREITEARWFALPDIPPEMSGSQQNLVKIAVLHRENMPN